MKKIVVISAIVFIVVIFLLSHSTPKMAISTHLLFMGYPKESFISNIFEYEFENKVDQNHFLRLNPNAKVYSITKPPFEKATGSELSHYMVRKIGLFYFADFYGET
ncbi:hypothetical protein [Neobacillus sp. Marseille-QA0830]